MGRPLPFEDLVERFLGIAEAGWVFGLRGLKFEATDIRLYIYIYIQVCVATYIYICMCAQYIHALGKYTL